jgi:CubicO group peptidase (beta-lactamase class C family)
MQRWRRSLSFLVLAMTAGCGTTEPSPESTARTPATTPEPVAPAAATVGFRWLAATPESQGMCGSTKQLGCTRTLQQVWNGINRTIHNTKRFLVIRNDRVIFDRGLSKPYAAYSSSKGLLGAPTLVHAMSRCGVGLGDRASIWLGHADGARWTGQFPWADITVEQLASHTSGLCDYEDASTVCRNESPGWQTAYDKARGGGPTYVYPLDLFTVARARAEQNREPASTPGTTWQYSNVGHSLLNYVVQRACGESLNDIYQLYIRQTGMGAPTAVPLISSDEGQVFNQSTGILKWNGLDGAAVLRLATRAGIWDNRNVEPVRYWDLVTRTTGNIAAAAALGWGVVYNNNSTDIWTAAAGHRRLSPELFGHGGNYSNVFLTDPLTGTIVVRQGENNAKGASYLTTNGCAPGWTGTAPTCTAGTNWSNNWNVSSGAVNFSTIGPRKKVVDPLQEAFFFPPPFCRMTAAAGQPIDAATDVYAAAPGDPAIQLEAEITVDPREGTGSSVADRVEFYQESDAGMIERIGDGTLLAAGNPARYALSYDAAAHGAVGDVRTYFANCVARSTRDNTKFVPSYSRPVRVSRN